MTVSLWWVAVAFFVGDCAGMILSALMFAASAESENPEGESPAVQERRCQIRQSAWD